MEDVTHEFLTLIEKLTPLQQKQVLDYTRELLGEPRQLTPGKICSNLRERFPRKIWKL